MPDFQAILHLGHIIAQSLQEQEFQKLGSEELVTLDTQKEISTQDTLPYPQRDPYPQKYLKP